jgi:toxin ParE1/3/4
VTSKRVVLREEADRDIADALAHYLSEGADQAALQYVDALEHAFASIGRHPGIGSYRFAHELDLPGLRSWRIKRFPYIVFYVERSDHIDVWRVLHGQRDLPAWMREPE